MMAIKSKFDGSRIEVPAELRGAPAGEVVIVYDSPPSGPAQRPSVWTYFGQAARRRTAEDINEQIRQERQSWDEA
jgi:hypothetical protein